MEREKRLNAVGAFARLKVMVKCSTLFSYTVLRKAETWKGRVNGGRLASYPYTVPATSAVILVLF